MSPVRFLVALFLVFPDLKISIVQVKLTEVIQKNLDLKLSLPNVASVTLDYHWSSFESTDNKVNRESKNGQLTDGSLSLVSTYKKSQFFALHLKIRHKIRNKRNNWSRLRVGSDEDWLLSGG